MVDGPVLIDDRARRRITTGLQESLFVEAGAGAGKTTALVQRIVGLVRSGVPIESIAAITFTEAAATELRVRVRAALSAETETVAMARARDALETAAFTTLHGFALRLLGEHPIEANLPPGFSVQDEIRSTLTFEDDLAAFLAELGDDEAEAELQLRGEMLDIKPTKMAAIARRFDDNWDLLTGAPPADDLPPLSTAPMVARVRALADLRRWCQNPDCPVASDLRVLAEDLDRIENVEELFQLEWLAAVKLPPRNRGKKDDWAGGGIAEVRETIRELRDEIDEFKTEQQAAVLRRYARLLDGFITDRVERRRRRGELAFHDLLVLARSLLRTDERVRLELHQRYRHLLLDEFQDTDPIQIELAVLLSHPGPIDGRPWVELAPEVAPGRLVVVGDPKQSIYRFRRADISVYDAAGRSIGDEPTVLSTNFRSVPGVIEWVNSVFGDEIGDGIPDEQPPYIPLVAHREPLPAEAGPAVSVIGGPVDGPVGAIRDLEADAVASAVVTVDDESWQVNDDGVLRDARLSDIAVLIPSRLSLPSLEASLSAAGIPFRPETSSLVYATQEIRDLTAALRAIAQPGNRIAVVAALRSTIFGIGDDDLFDWWERSNGAWDYRGEIDDPALADLAVGRAFVVLRAWHDDHWFVDPASLIDRIVAERRLREIALAGARPRDAWRRYRFLAEQARRFAESQGGDLQDFCGWVEVQSSESARVTEPIPHEPDNDAVRILTIHGSKGLEFPIVILAGAPTEEQAGSRGPSVIFPGGGAEPEISLGAGRRTDRFAVMAPVEEMLDRAERVRLHYVAATRARDHLVVSAHHSSTRNASSMGRRTFVGCGNHPETWVPLERRPGARLRPRAAVQLAMADIDRHDDAVREWQREQDGIRRRTALDGTRSATSLTADAEPQPDPERRPWRRGRAGTSIGSAVHAVLQFVDLADGRDVAELSRHWAEVEGVGGHTDEVRQRVEHALASPTVREAASGRHRRELPIAVPIGTTTFEGIVDLVIERDDGLLVVDYKTDGVRDADDAARLVQHYRRQGAGYAEALARLTGRPVVGCRFLFVGLDGVVEADLPDLDVARAEVVGQLEAGS